MALNRLTINRAAVGAILRSPEMGEAVTSAARQIASDVAAERSTTYGILSPEVQSATTGGARGDRVTAHVVVPAPPDDAVRYPDRDRFAVLQRVAGRVTR